MWVNINKHGLYIRGDFVLSKNINQINIKRQNALRLSNEESNRITLESIESALIILMKENNFQSISITDIIRKAGVSRSAYYRNYNSKEDILTNLFNRAAEIIVDALSLELETKNMVNSYRVLFEKVLEIKELFEIIQMAGMVTQFEMTINKKYLNAVDINSSEEYYRVLSWIGSIFNIIFGWIRREYQETPEQMAYICSRFLSEKEWQIGTEIKWNINANQ